jgi:uncharacterized protein YndB with AHSA1/START domain
VPVPAAIAVLGLFRTGRSTRAVNLSHPKEAMKHLISPGKNGRSRPMAEPLAAIRVTSRFSAPPERVFNAWLDPEVAGKWLFATALRPVAHVEIDARVGGSFRFAERRDGEIIERTGEYIEIVPRPRLVFTLSIEDHPQVITRATVEITPLKTGCQLTLIHEDVPQDYADDTEARWTGILYGLGVTLDSRSRGRGSS